MAWNFKQVGSDTTEIYIYDVIADKQSTDWYTGKKRTEVTPVTFKDELDKVTTGKICVRINSRGGEVFAAEAIRTAIRERIQSGTEITCKIDGFCGSAATGISAACNKTLITSSAWYMIHDPSVFLFGHYEISDAEKIKNMLEKVKQGLVSVYVDKTGKSKEKIAELMKAETWYTGDEAVEAGFCDELMFEEEKDGESAQSLYNIQNQALHDYSMYRNVPAALINSESFAGRTNKGVYGGFPQERPEVSAPVETTPSAAVSHPSKEGNYKTNKGEQSMEIKTVEELKAAYPELVAQAEAAAAETATKAERERIKAIEDVALGGFDELVAKAKFDTPVSAEAVAMQMIAAQKKQGGDYLAARAADVAESGMEGVKPEGSESGAAEAKTPQEKQAKAKAAVAALLGKEKKS
jgi:ATP-dependent protease ClpP protease subunit